MLEGTLRVAQVIAERFYDGHFTVMKFTTNWRVGFGSQPSCRDDIQKMAQGETLEQAVLNALVKVIAAVRSEG